MKLMIEKDRQRLIQAARCRQPIHELLRKAAKARRRNKTYTQEELDCAHKQGILFARALRFLPDIQPGQQKKAL